MIPVQGQLALIPHEVQNDVINQRAIDGYINATAMCKVAGRLWGDYHRRAETNAFLNELSSVMGIPITGLIQTRQGGIPQLQGTWVHPQVAIHLAQWLSPKFAVMVTEWVVEWLSGGGVPFRTPIPDHVRRYIINQPKIPHTHFSMLNQMFLRLLAPLEAQGYILPPEMMPDIALGRMFSKWCREHGYDPDNFPTYQHEFLDHRPTVEARLYPNELMTAFNAELESWLTDGRALEYFKVRHQAAIDAVNAAIEALPKPEDREETAA